jgi:hypothetical protein
VAEPGEVIEGYRILARSIDAKVRAALAAAWRLRMAADPDDQAAAAFAARAASLTTAGQRLMATATDRYLAELDAAVTGQPRPPTGVPLELSSTENLRGVEAVEVWGRPAKTVWTDLGQGASVPEATGKGLNRALALGSTGLQLAHAHTAVWILSGVVVGALESMRAPSVTSASRRAASSRGTSYRRVPRANSCDLCVGASRRTYRTNQPMPIHPACHCVAAPVYDRWDPAELADTEVFVAEPAEVVVRNHGEIGPVLSHAGHAFTGPEDLAPPSEVE